MRDTVWNMDRNVSSAEIIDDILLRAGDGSANGVLRSLPCFRQRVVPRVKVLPILDDDGITNCTDANRSVDIPSASSSEHSCR